MSYPETLEGRRTRSILVDGKNLGNLPVLSVDRYAHVVNMTTAGKLNVFPSGEVLQVAETVDKWHSNDSRCSSNFRTTLPSSCNYRPNWRSRHGSFMTEHGDAETLTGWRWIYELESVEEIRKGMEGVRVFPRERSVDVV